MNDLPTPMSTLDNDPFARLCARLRTATPEAAIRGAAVSLLTRLNLGNPPIPLRPVLRHLGVRFSWSKESAKPGAGAASLVRERGGYRILVHEPEFPRAWRRTRFTIAHEAIHVMVYALLKDAEAIQRLDGDTATHQRLERICDIGAAELLMPVRHVRRDVRRWGLSPNAMLSFYDRYLVSREAIVRRIAEVLPDGAVIRWRVEARHSDEEKRLRVIRSYPGYDRKSRRAWLPRGATTKHVPNGGANLEAETLGYVENCELTVSGRTWRASGYVTRFPATRENPLPLFERLTIPDEKPAGWQRDILLFLGESGFAHSWLPEQVL